MSHFESGNLTNSARKIQSRFLKVTDAIHHWANLISPSESISLFSAANFAAADALRVDGTQI